MRSTLIVFIVVCLITACKKNDNSSAPETPGSPTDTIRGILLSSREYVSGQLTTYLTMYDSTGTILWKRTGNDNGGTPNPAYSKGQVYFPVSTFVPSTSSSYSTLYSLNVNTGGELWRYRENNLTMSTPVIVNDTVYVANYLKLYAFSSAGTLLWAKPMANLQPYQPATDGKTLFLISAPLTTAFYSLHAVDIKTRNVLWTVPMGYNPPGGMFVWNNLLVYTDGAQKLVALDKATGAQQWVKTNTPYKQFIYDDKNIYIFNHSSSDMLLALDLNTGAQIWKFPYPFYVNESLYMFNKKIFFMAWNGSKRYMNCVSVSTGDTLWRKPVDINASFSTPIVTDKDVFYFKSGLVDLTPRILRFNAETFTPKDSFVVNGVEVGQPRIVMRSGAIY